MSNFQIIENKHSFVITGWNVLDICLLISAIILTLKFWSWLL
jgi:hypothetical protein